MRRILSAFGSVCLLTWALAGQLQALVISEIMYRSNERAEDSSYIELYNENPDPLDLGGHFICEGVDFWFPRGTWLPGRSFLVVCANEQFIREKYGLTNVVGNWNGDLGRGLELGVGAGHGDDDDDDDDDDKEDLRIAICDRGGMVVCSLRFDDRWEWPAGADGTGHSLELRDPFVDPGAARNWTLSGNPGGSPGVANPCWRGGSELADQKPLIEVGDTWRYLKGTVEPPPDWKEPEFNDGAWHTGPTGIGYGDDDDATILDDMEDRYLTIFCRKNFHVDSPAAITELLLSIAIDDGFIAYLNGLEIASFNVNGRAWEDTASEAIEPTLRQHRVPADLLRQGANVLAVQVHNASLSSDDLSFIPRLLALTGTTRCRRSVVINEAFLRTSQERWVELYNKGSAPVDLSGHFLTDEVENLTKSTLPDGTTIAAQGWLSFSEAELGMDLEPRGEGPSDAGAIFIALVEPDGAHVVDAVKFSPQFDDRSQARLPDGARYFSPAAEPTREAANVEPVNTEIVINEVMYHPIDGDPNKEYVELYNRGAQAVDLTGWKLTEGIEYAFPEGTVILPDGYLVIARDPERIRAVYGLPDQQVLGPDAWWAASGEFQDGGARITLRDEFRRIVDTLEYRVGGEWSRWAAGHGSSLELIDPRQDNSFGQAWDASDDSSKAVVQEYSYFGRHTGGESELHALLLSRGITVVDDVEVIRGSLELHETPIIEVGEIWKYFKGTEPPPETWSQPDFDDGSWLEGPTGIGYGDDDDATVLDDMQGNYLTIFCRKTFTLSSEEINGIDELVLSVIIDDGFVAHLNGTQVALYNVAGRAWDAPAAEAVESALVELDLSPFKNLLRIGANVLAVQVHNSSLMSSDLTFIPRLIDRTRTAVAGANLVVNSTFDQDVTHWIIEGTHWRSGRTTADSIRGAGSLKIIASGPGDNAVNRIETANSGIGTLNTGEDFEIRFKARWVVGSPTILTHGFEHGMAKANALVVPEDLGTPGRRNSASVRLVARAGRWNLGPVITDVSQDPVVPDGGEAVTVTARIRDSDGVASVTLYYSPGAPSPTPAGVAMLDDGDHGDGLAGDGVYGGRIPEQPLGTTVVFHITAHDGSGERGRYPADVTERAHPLLLDPRGAASSDQPYLLYRHDAPSNAAGSYHDYRFYMTEADEQMLSARRLMSQDLVEGSFVFEDRRIHYGSRLRFEGSAWMRRAWSGSYRVVMPPDDLLHETINEFSLEQYSGDGPDARPRVAHHLRSYAQSPQDGPYSEAFTLARWKVNDRFSGTRERASVANRRFLERWFPGDENGDFFEMDDRLVFNDEGNRTGHVQAGLLFPPHSPASDGDGLNKENYRWFFRLLSKEGADDYSRLFELAQLMDPGVTSDAEFDQRVSELVNVGAFVRTWAVNLNIDAWNTWGAQRGMNVFFYRPEHGGRWHFFSKKTDFLTFGNVDSFLPPQDPSAHFFPGPFPEVNRMLDRPAIKRLYYAVVCEMVNDWFSSQFLSTYMNQLAALGMTNTQIGQPGGFIDQRAVRLRSRIRDACVAGLPFSITTNGGGDFETEEARVSLEGIAPFRVATLMVSTSGGRLENYPTEFPTVTTWVIREIPLAVGPNELRVVGLDMDSELVDSDTITVTRTSSSLLFIRGEANGDANVNISDPITILGFLFLGNPGRLDCDKSADADDGGSIDLTDAVYLLNFLFLSGPPPGPPSPGCGVDPTEDTLRCESFSPCE